MDYVNVFASVLPGRIRLRHRVLRDPAVHAGLSARLGEMVRVQGDPAVGSLLLTFDPAASDMEGRVRAIVAEILPAEPAAKKPVPHVGKRIALKRPKTAKQELNRAAKIGAVVSMAVSLAALGTSKKLHAQAGFVFVAMMLAHMAVHWRRTFK